MLIDFQIDASQLLIIGELRINNWDVQNTKKENKIEGEEMAFAK